MASKQSEGYASTPGRKAVTKKFRPDLVERLKALAAQIRPRTSVTAVMEAAFEEYLERHERRDASRQ
jgi:predicted transcriptional regulator